MPEPMKFILLFIGIAFVVWLVVSSNSTSSQPSAYDTADPYEWQYNP